MQILKIFAISLVWFILMASVEITNGSYMSHVTRPLSLIVSVICQSGVQSMYQNYYGNSFLINDN